MSRTTRRLTDDERKQFVIAETVCAAVMIALGLTATAVLHTPVFGAVLLLLPAWRWGTHLPSPSGSRMRQAITSTRADADNHQSLQTKRLRLPPAGRRYPSCRR